MKIPYCSWQIYSQPSELYFSILLQFHFSSASNDIIFFLFCDFFRSEQLIQSLKEQIFDEIFLSNILSYIDYLISIWPYLEELYIFIIPSIEFGLIRTQRVIENVLNLVYSTFISKDYYTLNFICYDILLTKLDVQILSARISIITDIIADIISGIADPYQINHPWLTEI